MPVRGQFRSERERGFSTPSPGEILRQQPVPPQSRAAPVALDQSPFAPDLHRAARIERGVLLAPLIVTWHYKVAAARPFAKWLKTKEVLLADARLDINADTRGTHYFGTYVEQTADAGPAEAPAAAVDCQTIWGFSTEAAMHHMFALGRGKVERMSIIETDLRDFVLGLKQHIAAAGSQHFVQKVLLAPAAR